MYGFRDYVGEFFGLIFSIAAIVVMITVGLAVIKRAFMLVF